MNTADAFVRAWEAAVHYTAVGICLRWPGVVSDEDDLVQVGRIAVWRSQATITKSSNKAFQLREAQQVSRNAMHRYLQAWRGWKRGKSPTEAKRGPAHLRGDHEGSDSLVWGVISVESHERWLLLREQLEEAVDAMAVLTPAQRRALLADDDVTREEQKRRAQLRLSARKKLKSTF